MKPTQIAAQLYTCRDLLQTPVDIVQTLARVRRVGYTAVELGGLGPISEEELVKILDGEGLTCCATHEPRREITEEPEAVIARLQKLGCQVAVCPGPTGVDFSSLTSVDAWIARLDAAGAKFTQAGITLCYHNHHTEFRRHDGATILERIYKRTAPANLQGELDTYWTQYGGGDILAWCQHLSGRLPLLHLKDYRVTADNKPDFAEIGNGNLDFSRIIPAAEKSGCKWFIVEQDTCPGDPVDSLAQSYHHLLTL